MVYVAQVHALPVRPPNSKKLRRTQTGGRLADDGDEQLVPQGHTTCPVILAR